MATFRRRRLAGAMSFAAAPAAAAQVGMPAPRGSLWGTAISGHQSEGNNTNSDSWVRENVRPTLFDERSGDGGPASG